MAFLVFCRAPAVPGHISYWTAYLKAHFPVEFLCGLMSNEVNNDKIGVFIQEANRMGIEILPPNVNKSMLKFTPEETPSCFSC